jgi:hypothetical protein
MNTVRSILMMDAPLTAYDAVYARTQPAAHAFGVNSHGVSIGFREALSEIPIQGQA